MWFVGALLGLMMAVVGHAALCRAPVPLNGVTRFLLIGSLVGACLVWWLVHRYGATAAQTWAAAVVYAFCCELYIFLFTFAMSSITANLLANLSRSDMSDADIEQLYDSRHMVATRLDRLVAVGLVDEGPTGLRLTTEGARMVRTFRRLRGLFRHPQPAYTFPTKD
jgi:uncharacterized membrane protein YeaQ/YmgE (transglycosylase-associated protein family)